MNNNKELLANEHIGRKSKMTDITKKYKNTVLACYFTGFSMSAAANLSALLFIPLHNLYGISFTQLGFLVLVNFCTQLAIDLVFTFFSDRFKLKNTIRSIPAIVLFGLLIYAVVPMAFPDYTYLALVVGTFVFSLGAGLGEVLTSPVIAAIPAENPEKEMSKLHSAYAWGVVGVVIISTLMLKIIGNENWMYLAIFWCVLPLISFVLFQKAEIPDLNLNSEEGSKPDTNNRFGIFLCTLCIFFGGAAEMSMTQWISGFSQNALGIDKVYGDIFGMALFAFALGSGRTLYAQKGKNIHRVLLCGMGLSCLCYIVAAISSNSLICLIACVLTGFFTSMLWPGTLIYTNEKFTSCGVGVYALLAAGGDLGASVSPQIMGIIADEVSQSRFAQGLFDGFGPEETGMKLGMLFAAIFPLIGFFLLVYMKKYFFEHNNT